MESHRLILTIDGNSMAPLLNSGDTVEIDLSYKTFEVGDIVFFKSHGSEGFTLHRMVTEDGITKGDSSLIIDGPQQLLGKMIRNQKNNYWYEYKTDLSDKLIAFSSLKANNTNIVGKIYFKIHRLLLNLFNNHKKSY